MNELEKFKDFLIEKLTEAREFSKKCITPTSKAYINAKIELLEIQIIFLSKSLKEGTLDMEKAKSMIKVLDEGIIEEIGRARRESPITGTIIELAKELKPGRFKRIDPKEIDPAHFTTRVYNLRSQGLIPMDVKPKSNINGENGLFLVRLTEKQMSAEPKKRSKN